MKPELELESESRGVTLPIVINIDKKNMRVIEGGNVDWNLRRRSLQQVKEILDLSIFSYSFIYYFVLYV